MTTKEAFEKVSGNKEFLTGLRNMKKPEDVYEALKTVGLTDSLEEFKKTVKTMKESYSKLNAEDMDSAMGGGDTITTTTATTIPVAASAAAASI